MGRFVGGVDIVIEAAWIGLRVGKKNRGSYFSGKYIRVGRGVGGVIRTIFYFC